MKNKRTRISAWMVAMAIAGLAMPLTACSNDDNEVNAGPQATPPALYACGIGNTSSETRADGTADIPDMLFTEDDIEWFNVTTRELRFCDTMKPLVETIRPYWAVEFHLGDGTLFVADNFVNIIISRTYNDLVLCYGKAEGEVADDGRYYLYDCYPLQFIDDEIVQANRAKRADQWAAFTSYLESKGKLRK